MEVGQVFELFLLRIKKQREKGRLTPMNKKERGPNRENGLSSGGMEENVGK